MAGGGDPDSLTGSFGQQFTALFVVVLFATAGGIFVQILMKGIKF